MQLIAMITMLIDHIGYLFFPEESIWRIIGRIAFPLYAYGIILGYRNTSNLRKYVIRLAILAIISQIPFMLAFHKFALNAIVTLLISLITIMCVDRFQRIESKVGIVIISTLIAGFLPMDYGPYGLLLVVLYRYTSNYMMILSHFCLNLVFLISMGWVLQMYSLIATVMLILLPQILVIGRKSIPKWIWRSFYPAHLLLLAIINEVLHNMRNFFFMLK